MHINLVSLAKLPWILHKARMANICLKFSFTFFGKHKLLLLSSYILPFVWNVFFPYSFGLILICPCSSQLSSNSGLIGIPQSDPQHPGLLLLLHKLQLPIYLSITSPRTICVTVVGAVYFVPLFPWWSIANTQ